jgi:hypothetical protein
VFTTTFPGTTDAVVGAPDSSFASVQPAGTLAPPTPDHVLRFEDPDTASIPDFRRTFDSTEFLSGGVPHTAEFVNRACTVETCDSLVVAAPADAQLSSLTLFAADGRVVGNAFGPRVLTSMTPRTDSALDVVVTHSTPDLSVRAIVSVDEGTSSTLVWFSSDVSVGVGSLTPGAFHEIYFAHSATHDALYVDGVLASCQSATGSLAPGQRTLTIGKSTFTGRLFVDTLEVYDGYRAPHALRDEPAVIFDGDSYALSGVGAFGMLVEADHDGDVSPRIGYGLRSVPGHRGDRCPGWVELHHVCAGQPGVCRQCVCEAHPDASG